MNAIVLTLQRARDESEGDPESIDVHDFGPLADEIISFHERLAASPRERSEADVRAAERARCAKECDTEAETAEAALAARALTHSQAMRVAEAVRRVLREPCPPCEGSGVLEDGAGDNVNEYACDACFGSGRNWSADLSTLVSTIIAPSEVEIAGEWVRDCAMGRQDALEAAIAGTGTHRALSNADGTLTDACNRLRSARAAK
jgi:hypothetical protein